MHSGPAAILILFGSKSSTQAISNGWVWVPTAPGAGHTGIVRSALCLPGGRVLTAGEAAGHQCQRIVDGPGNHTERVSTTLDGMHRAGSILEQTS